MRLIDADRIIINGIENGSIEIRTSEIIERDYTRVYILFNDLNKLIDEQPTVYAVPKKENDLLKEKYDRLLENSMFLNKAVRKTKRNRGSEKSAEVRTR